jgi:hypothetical protein
MDDQKQHELSDLSVAFVQAIAMIDNDVMGRIGGYLKTESPAFRARLIERCSSLIGEAATIDAGE